MRPFDDVSNIKHKQPRTTEKRVEIDVDYSSSSPERTTPPRRRKHTAAPLRWNAHGIAFKVLPASTASVPYALTNRRRPCLRIAPPEPIDITDPPSDITDADEDNEIAVRPRALHAPRPPTPPRRVRPETSKRSSALTDDEDREPELDSLFGRFVPVRSPRAERTASLCGRRCGSLLATEAI